MYKLYKGKPILHQCEWSWLLCLHLNMNISEMEYHGTVTFLKNNLVQEDKTTDRGQSGRANLVMGCISQVRM